MNKILYFINEEDLILTNLNIKNIDKNHFFLWLIVEIFFKVIQLCFCLQDLRIKLIISLNIQTKMIPTGLGGFMNQMAAQNLKNLAFGMSSHQNQAIVDKTAKFKDYPRQNSFLIIGDWQINKQNGGLTLISKQKKKNQGKILKFVLKKFLTTGSFMGISFPVFAMKAQSILQTYAKSIACAPLFFDNIQTDPTQRMKKFVAFMFTFSRLFTDMDKPFNPVVGQTYQANIADGFYSAQQTSHHPPQTSFYFQGKGYRIFGTLQLGADIGVNSANGFFYGDINVEFQNGGLIFGRVLSGEMSGFVIGQNKFRPRSSSYAYDSLNKIICTYKRQHKDNFNGIIGILKQKYQQRFNQILKSKQRYTKFQAFEQKNFECLLSKMSACWTKHVSFNQKVYLDFEDQRYLPFKPTQENIKLLPSDSSFRKDIKLRGQGNVKQSQTEKQSVQDLQRYFRKLRKGQKNPKIEKNEVQRMQEQQLNNQN